MREKDLEREREEFGEAARLVGTGTSQEVEKEREHAAASDWKEAGRRKTEQRRIRTDVARNYQYFGKEDRRTSYFFTNFPDNFMAKHMLKAFLNYGDIEEVVIPAKRDRRGKRFGFVRAVGIQDPENFAIKLDNIIIGSEKIVVNLPRFDRSGEDQTGYAKNRVRGAGDGGEHRYKGRDQQLQTPVHRRHQSPPAPVHRRHQPLKGSYADAVKSHPNSYCPKTATHQNQKPPNDINPNRPTPFHNHPKPTVIHPKASHHLSYHSKTFLNQKQQNQKYKHGYVPPPRPKKPWAHRTFDVDEDQIQKFANAYVGVVKRP